MTDLLKQSWIATLVVQSLKISLDNNVPPENLFEGKDGDFGLSIERNKMLQLIRIESGNPLVAELSDKYSYVVAEFTDECLQTLQRQDRGPITSLLGAIFQLTKFKLVFPGSSAALVCKGVTAPKQPHRRRLSLEPKEGAAVSLPGIKLIVDNIRYLSGEGTPTWGNPVSVVGLDDVQGLLQRVPLESRVRRNLKTPNKKPTPTSAREGKKISARKEPSSPVSSQLFKTQPRKEVYSSESEDTSFHSQADHSGEDEGKYNTEDEDDGSVHSTQVFATQARRWSRPDSPKDIPTSSSKSTRPVLKASAKPSQYSDLNFDDLPGSTASKRRTSGTQSSSANRSQKGKENRKDKSAIIPPSSPPSALVRTKKQSTKESPQLPQHPGWGGLKKITARIATIPRDQLKRLERDDCWGVNEYKSGYDDLIRPQLEPKGYSPKHRRVRTTEAPVPTPKLNPQPVEEKQSEESEEELLYTWDTSPEQPLRRFNDEPPDSSLPGRSPLESRSCREIASGEEDGEDEDKGEDESEASDAAAETSEVEEQQDEMDEQSAEADAQPQEEAELDDSAVRPRTAASEPDEMNEQAQAENPEKISPQASQEATLVPQGITMETVPRRVFVGVAIPASEHVTLALDSDDEKQTQSRRLTRVRNGTVRRYSSSGATEPKGIKTRPRRVRRRAGPVVSDEEEPPPLRRSREEPPYPVKDPNGTNDVARYGIIGAQQVSIWRKSRKEELLKDHLVKSGQWEFPSDDENRDVEGLGEETESNAEPEQDTTPQPESGDRLGEAGKKRGEMQDSRQGNSSAIEEDGPTKPSSAVRTNPVASSLRPESPPVQPDSLSNPENGHDGDNDDDDIPCAQLVPLRQSRPRTSPSMDSRKVSISRNSAQVPVPKENAIDPTTSERPFEPIATTNPRAITSAPPPSTAPTNTIIQVKRTPFGRATSYNDLPTHHLVPFGDPDIQEMIPATNEQQPSSSRQTEPERQPATPQQEPPNKRQRLKRAPHQSSFTSQEIRDVPKDMASLLEAQRREFLAGGSGTSSKKRPLPSPVSASSEQASKRLRTPRSVTAVTFPVSVREEKMDEGGESEGVIDPKKPVKQEGLARLNIKTRRVEMPPPPPRPLVPAEPQLSNRRQEAGRNREGFQYSHNEELYAGFRKRNIEVPGYELLSAGELAEVEKRRREFFGTAEVVGWRFVGRSEQGQSNLTGATREDGRIGERQRREEEEGWWRDKDTPLRKFLGRFKNLRMVRRELGG